MHGAVSPVGIRTKDESVDDVRNPHFHLLMAARSLQEERWMCCGSIR